MVMSHTPLTVSQPPGWDCVMVSSTCCLIWPCFPGCHFVDILEWYLPMQIWQTAEFWENLCMLGFGKLWRIISFTLNRQQVILYLTHSGLGCLPNFFYLPTIQNYAFLGSACMEYKRKLCSNPPVWLVVLLAQGHQAMGYVEPYMGT